MRKLEYMSRDSKLTARQVFEEFSRVMFDSPPRTVGEMLGELFTLQGGRNVYSVFWADQYWQVWKEEQCGN